MYRRTKIIALGIGLILFGASCGRVATPVVTNSAPTANTTVRQYQVQYPGQDGKTALELLAQNHTIDATTQGYVNAIDGQAPQGRQYWAFYVNDTLAAVGAKDYITKHGETIGWRLESY